MAIEVFVVFSDVDKDDPVGKEAFECREIDFGDCCHRVPSFAVGGRLARAS